MRFTWRQVGIFWYGLLAIPVTLLVIWRIPDDMLLQTLLLSGILLYLSMIDIRFLLLPDTLTLPLLWLGLLSSALGLLPKSQLNEVIFGAAAGYGVLLLLAKGYQLLRGQAGLGMGDAKLLAALGAWLGLYWLPWLLLIASAMALLVIIAARVVTGRPLNQPLAFGPPLALSGWLLFLWQYSR